ncbi:MAG: hypothetical protein JNJ83_10885 [Verrucomicrobiaceae bacterium]|nr:hypothetical protein [Verrucomicrobiaceae bacterium]
MKDWIIKQAIGLQLPKLVRHLLTAVGAYFAAHGQLVNVESVPDLIVGSSMLLVAVLWSFISQAPLSGNWLEVIKSAAVAISRQAVTALSAWLYVDPTLIMNNQVGTTAILIAIANWLVSAVTGKPADGTTGLGKPALKIPR